MSTIWEVPVTPQAQTMRLDMAGTSFTLRFRWNQFISAWIMDVHDQNDLPLPGNGLNGVAIVTGTDIMGQFRYLGIGGGCSMVAMTIGPGASPDEVPTYTNFGIDGHLYYKTL